MAKPKPIMQFFMDDHLPKDMRRITGAVRKLAMDMMSQLPDSEETDAGMRKLLEAKDCFIRAKYGEQMTEQTSAKLMKGIPDAE